jgi:glycosyltransferase involved in cell wall biosynthesis
MKLSIITINYNNCCGLQATIDSVVSQTCQEFEWIIIDGGSSDGSREVIERNVQHFTYWCSESDRGIYNAMNKGIKKATGEYCMFLNSGDCLDGDCLKEVVPQLMGDVIVGRVKSAEDGALSYPYDNSTFSFTQLYSYSFPHQASFIKRDLFIKHGFYDEDYKILSDWKFFLQLLLKERVHIEFISDVVSVIDYNGISKTNKELFVVEKKRLQDEIIPPYLMRDLEYSSSLRDLFNHKIGKKLYSFLYRFFVSKK